MRRLTRFVAAALILAACARPGAPPGGPPRLTPPRLLATVPSDSECSLPGFRNTVDFVFDEVVNEGSQPNFGYGSGDLEKLVLLSPDTLVPQVRWHRNRISVRPRHGWMPNTVYRIELSPGVADLRRNVSKAPGLVTFTTGTTCPTLFLSGRAVDWAAHRAVPGALVEAFQLPDSVRYRTVADSTGRFHLGPLPDGPYLVVAVADQNHDHKRQPTEPWDSVRVAAGVDTVGEIWTFQRDTLPPKVQSAARQDSQTISVTFTRPIDPYQHLDSTAMRVLVVIGTDTANIVALAAYPKAKYDSVYVTAAPVRPPPKDTTGARADTLHRDSLPAAAPPARPARGGRGTQVPDTFQQHRPALGAILVIRTQGRVQLGQHYIIELRGVRSAAGTTGPVIRYVLETPKAPTAADSAKARADSLKADSLKKTRPDSSSARRP